MSLLLQELKEEDEKSLCRNESSYSGSAEELAWTEMADQTLTPCKTPCYTMALSILKSRRNILTSPVTEDFLHNTGILVILGFILILYMNYYAL